MKRLVKKSARHNMSTRDSAIVYIDGAVYEANTHSDCFRNHGKARLDVVREGKNAWPADWPPPQDKVQYVYNYYSELGPGAGAQIGYAHTVKKDKAIFIDEPSLFNVDKQTVANGIKKYYQDYTIYNDENAQPATDPSEDAGDGFTYEKLASKKFK